jgi:hypothetical protein
MATKHRGRPAGGIWEESLVAILEVYTKTDFMSSEFRADFSERLIVVGWAKRVFQSG